MKKLIITGSSGFIGSSFLNEYKDEYEIIPISLSKTVIKDIDFEGVDCVLHLSAIVHNPDGATQDDYFKVNTILTKELAEKAKAEKVKQFVFLSTVNVYGYSGFIGKDILINEDTITNPIEAYGISKLAAEKILTEMEDDNFTISIIRPPVVYGENCKGNFIKLMWLMKFFKILPFYYFGNKRSVCYIKNLIHYLDLVMKNKLGGIFIPKDKEDLSLGDIATIIDSYAGMGYLIKIPRLLLNTFKNTGFVMKLFGSLRFDSKKGDLISGFVPKFTAKKGLENMAKWYYNERKTKK